MRAQEIMQRNGFVVTPVDRVASAAEVMHYDTDACVPIVKAREDLVLVGVITARDIAVRCVARGHRPGCLVRDHMTPMPLLTVGPDEDIGEAYRKMELADVRRIPVVNEDGVLLGILREADIVERLRPRRAAAEPARKPRRRVRAGTASHPRVHGHAPA